VKNRPAAGALVAREPGRDGAASPGQQPRGAAATISDQGMREPLGYVSSVLPPLTLTRSSTCPRARHTTQLHASCLARLKDARASLLASLRASRTRGELSDEAAVSAPDAVAAAVRQVISQELAAASAGACVAAGEKRANDGVRP